MARFEVRMAATAGVKVGLVWAGSPIHKNNRNRSLELTVLAPLLAMDGVAFFSLQKGEPAAEISANGFEGRVVDLGPDLKDFADTAAVISCLDLVISIDTAVAHLAGALGKPVWTLISFVPDWRWLLERCDTPWYPTMRLYRQPAIGDWEAVIEKVTADLSHRAEQTALPLRVGRAGRPGSLSFCRSIAPPQSRTPERADIISDACSPPARPQSSVVLSRASSQAGVAIT